MIDQQEDSAKSLRQRLWSRPRKWWLLGIPVGGFAMFLAGVVFWGGFNWAMSATNSEAFCVSCHEMQEFVLPEYQESRHYLNTSGVRASCSDCHVPKPWGYKVVRKIYSTKEVWGKITGVISTREKFEAHRAVMAERVWDSMRKSDSRECRNCHEMQFMDLENQERSAMKKHKRVIDGDLDKTCIDCHQGLAHRLPDES